MTSNIEVIARSLSKAQRRSILDASDCFSDHGGYPFFTVRITCQPWPQGVAQFLTLNTDRLTPTGLQLRNHLRAQEGSAGGEGL